MLFVTTQPDSDYYIWQLQVQLNNFKKFGVEDKCVVIFGFNPQIGVNPNARAFEDSTTAKVLYYPDRRDLSTRLYLPSIRPHLLKQLYRNNPEIIENLNFIYLDSDVIFADYPNFSKLNEEKFIHISDTSNQFVTDFIKTHDRSLFEKMCKIVGISPYVVEKNKSNSGGLVYLFKHFNYMDYAFWEKVEKDCAQLYKMMLVSIKDDSEIQNLTANKLAFLWNLWLIGYDTKVSTELSVSWATNPIEDWYKHKLYNNASVDDEFTAFLFKKTDFVENSPFEADLSYVSDKYCSYKYVDELLSTKKALNPKN